MKWLKRPEVWVIVICLVSLPVVFVVGQNWKSSSVSTQKRLPPLNTVNDYQSQLDDLYTQQQRQAAQMQQSLYEMAKQNYEMACYQWELAKANPDIFSSNFARKTTADFRCSQALDAVLKAQAEMDRLKP